MTRKNQSANIVQNAYVGEPVIIIMTHCKHIDIKEIGAKGGPTQKLRILVEVDNFGRSEVGIVPVELSDAESILSAAEKAMEEHISNCLTDPPPDR